MSSRIRSISLEEFNELVSHIYDASLDLAQWTQLLQMLAKTFNAKSGMLRIQDIRKNKVFGYYTHGLDPWYQKRYAEHFVKCDPVVQRLEKLNPGYVDQTATGLPKDYFRQSEYFNDYAKPQENTQLCGGIVGLSNNRIALFGIQRADIDGPYTDYEMSLLRVLFPHLRRAVNINGIIGSLSSQLGVANELFDKLTTGVVLVNRFGHPLFVNKAAEAIFANDEGFELSQNEMVLPRRGDTKELQKLIYDASQSDGFKRGGYLSVLIPSQPYSVSIIVAPVNSESNVSVGFGLSNASAIVYIDTRKKTSQEFSLEILQQLYGLTKAEAKLVVELCDGKSMDEMSGKFKVSKETLRTHLKACLRKTGTKRQVDLVRLVLTGPASLIATSKLIKP